MMDALAHASVDDEEECDGEEGDAIGAYTQAKPGGPKIKVKWTNGTRHTPRRIACYFASHLRLLTH
jgi:hypothetical protein